MSIIENIKMALNSIRAHKLRSILTMLGVIIGVGAVIIVVAIGQGGEAMLKSELVGEENTLNIYYQPTEDEIAANPNIWAENFFTQADIRSLERIPEIKRVIPYSFEYSKVGYRTESTDAYVNGITESYLDVYPLNVEFGTSFSSTDFIGGRRTALITASLNEQLFEEESGLGKIIRVNQQPVEIVGILEKPTGIFAFGVNEVYLPADTWGQIFGKNTFNQVSVQATNADNLQIAGEKAVDVLNANHNTQGYEVFNMEEIAAVVGQVTTIMTMIIGGIASISLLVGGIGVMNIMLVSVTERTREIGIRKALGATRSQILVQFLIESVILTLIGGLIGIALGAGLASLISLMLGWPSLVSIPVIVGATVFSMAIGVIFGILPANKASRLNPIDSLRFE